MPSLKSSLALFGALMAASAKAADLCYGSYSVSDPFNSVRNDQFVIYTTLGGETQCPASEYNFLYDFDPTCPLGRDGPTLQYDLCGVTATFFFRGDGPGDCGQAWLSINGVEYQGVDASNVGSDEWKRCVGDCTDDIIDIRNYDGKFIFYGIPQC